MRPQSTLTGQRPRNIVGRTPEAPGVAIRWTEKHHITFLKLGGSKWLRQEIEKHMKKD